LKKVYTEYWKRLLETVAFSYGNVSSYEHVQREHRHIHPSGYLEPSKVDTMMTDRMIRLTELMGIPLVDHIIVGGDSSKYFSFREKKMLKNPTIHMHSDYKMLDFENKSMV